MVNKVKTRVKGLEIGFNFIILADIEFNNDNKLENIKNLVDFVNLVIELVEQRFGLKCDEEEVHPRRTAPIHCRNFPSAPIV